MVQFNMRTAVYCICWSVPVRPRLTRSILFNLALLVWCDKRSRLRTAWAITVGDSTTSILLPVQDGEAEGNGCGSSTRTVVSSLLCQNGTDFSYDLIHWHKVIITDYQRSPLLQCSFDSAPSTAALQRLSEDCASTTEPWSHHCCLHS